MALLFQLMALGAATGAMIALSAALFGVSTAKLSIQEIDAEAENAGMRDAASLLFIDGSGRAAIIVGSALALAVIRLGDRRVARRLPLGALTVHVDAEGARIDVAGMARACVRVRAEPGVPLGALVRRLHADRAPVEPARSRRLEEVRP